MVDGLLDHPLEVGLVGVVDHCQEHGHEHIEVDNQIKDEEHRVDPLGIVGRHLKVGINFKFSSIQFIRL